MTKSTGDYGEQLAEEYLSSKDYEIITTKWRTKKGEIDIVAKQDETWVFVEVRTRHAKNTETAFESVDSRKQAKLQELAYLYLSENDIEGVVWRVDVVGVALRGAAAPIIDHVEDALGW